MNKMTDIFSGLSVAAILGALAGLLPPIAALVGIIYYGILIYESQTMKSWRKNRHLRKLEKLRAKVAVLTKLGDGVPPTASGP